MSEPLYMDDFNQWEPPLASERTIGFLSTFVGQPATIEMLEHAHALGAQAEYWQCRNRVCDEEKVKRDLENLKEKTCLE